MKNFFTNHVNKRGFYSIIKISLLLNFLLLSFYINLYSQDETSSIGDRENIGIFGGPAYDLSFVYGNNRLFAAVQSPGTLFYTDDTCTTWVSAFPFDSLEYEFGTRGWGGGASHVLTNIKGWVAVRTNQPESQLSSSVISFEKGNNNTFQTAIDPFMLEQITSDNSPVSAIGLSEHYMYIGLGKYLVRINDTTTFGSNIIVARVDTIPGGNNNSVIQSIAVSNDVTGYPIYLVISSSQYADDGKLYKYDGTYFNLILSFPANYNVNTVFTHTGQITGDTTFISCKNISTNVIDIFRTLNGGIFWLPVTPLAGAPYHLTDADYSPDWVLFMQNSNGLRLSFPSGLISDDLGDTWLQAPLSDYRIATHPIGLDLIAGSKYYGVVVSYYGIYGPYEDVNNICFTAINVNKIAESMDVFYIATDAGLAYSTEYYNLSITGFEQWQPPYGDFPIPNVGNEMGVTSVAIDPYDSLHVIAGYSNGFNVTFNGPYDFIPVTPPNWNTSGHLDPFVTDIIFITSDTIVAVTGFKFKELQVPSGIPIGNIWLSVNGGINWSIVTPTGPDVFEQGNCLNKGYIVGPYAVIYAGAGYLGGTSPSVQGALWKSLDNGLTWYKENDGPLAGSNYLPIYDIDVNPYNPDVIYLAADQAFAVSNNGGSSYFITSVPNNTGSFTSVLIDPLYPDTISAGAGRNIYKYDVISDEYDLKFQGMPGEFIPDLENGSVMAGTSTGAHKISEAPRYYLDITIFLEGPYNGPEMGTQLNSNGYLPLSQPYNTPPWNYTGTESVSSIPNSDIVDWVLIELRETAGDSSSATADKRFNRQAAFLLKNGSVVGTNGSSDPRFNFVVAEDLYGVIYNHNHILVMSADALSLNSETFGWNFTTGANQAYGGLTGHKEIATGVWGMASGDGDGDGQVTNGDKIDVWSVQTGSSGYYNGDFSLNGQVDNVDKNDYWIPNSGFGTPVSTQW
ncbi:MAG: hypothetical protein K8R58_11140 [Bacteroidales bacterium]|nr:hypothetical protein [Bacteroidales bacterium]